MLILILSFTLCYSMFNRNIFLESPLINKLILLYCRVFIQSEFGHKKNQTQNLFLLFPLAPPPLLNPTIKTALFIIYFSLNLMLLVSFQLFLYLVSHPLVFCCIFADQYFSMSEIIIKINWWSAKITIVPAGSEVN
jgi:hypothetical protein